MEWLRNSPKVTQLLNDRAKIQTQAALPDPEVLASDHSTTLSQCRSDCSFICSGVGHVLSQSQGGQTRSRLHRLMMLGPRAVAVQIPLWKNKNLYNGAPRL